MAIARAVTQKNTDEVYDLKWLGNDNLVFDRVADEVFYRHARIWKAAALGSGLERTGALLGRSMA